MSLLRSVIADARPRKSVSEFPVNPSAAVGWRTRELSWDTPESREQLADTSAQTSHLSRSLPNDKSASKLMKYDAPDFTHQLNNPIEQDIQGTTRNSEQIHPLSVPEEMPATNSDKSTSELMKYDAPDFTQLNNSIEQDIQGTTRNAEEMPATNPGPPEEKRSTIPGEDSHLTIHTDNAPDIDTYSENNQIAGHRVSDSISFPKNIEKAPGKNIIANNANTIHQEKESAGLTENNESQLSATEENTPAQGELSGITAIDENRYTDRSTKSSLGVTADSVGRNESEHGLVDGAQPNRVPPGTDKQTNLKLSSNLEDNHRLQKQGNAKATVGADQLVSRQSPVKDLHTSSDEKLSPILQSVDKQESTQANSPASVSANPPGSVPSKSNPSNSIQQISRPSRSSANSEFFSPVHARSTQAELIAKNSTSFHAGPLARVPEKKYESPKVQIGQIDVIVAAAPQSVTKPIAASSPIDLASRHYLRRL